jgi:signal transduction histidine kinase
VFPAVFAIVPVVLFAGILRYRLWNFDWLLSRALLYGSLAAAVGFVYVGAVSLAGLGVGGGLWTAVIVLSVVAVAIDPLRRALKSWSNRIVYGQVLSPADAVQTMLSSLDRLSPDAELAQLTKTVTQATRARRAELWLAAGDHLLRIAAYPEPDGPGHRPLPVGDDEGTASDSDVPIVFQGRPLGRLTAHLPPGGHLVSVEAALIADLAAHAGVVVHNAALNTELAQHVARLQQHVDELRASRRRLVATQDAERRKLERDLHDGAQQSLVAVLIGLQTVAALDHEPASQRAEVQELIQLLGDTSATLTGLVSDQGPPVLVEQGLAGALRTAAELGRRSGQQIRVAASISPDVPGEVTAAVYFCCMEAIQNATKHAGATCIAVTVSETDGTIDFEVTDDGKGFDPSKAVPGSGLRNLPQRLSVLGGDVIVESAPGSGTTVRGWLPVARSGDAE